MNICKGRDMKEEKDGKRAWMGVLADYYDVDGKEKKLIENVVMEKWRNSLLWKERNC